MKSLQFYRKLSDTHVVDYIPFQAFTYSHRWGRFEWVQLSFVYISSWSGNYSSGGLALANGLLNAASTAPLDVLVLERDTDEYLRERGGYQIRVSLPVPKAECLLMSQSLW